MSPRLRPFLSIICAFWMAACATAPATVQDTAQQAPAAVPAVVVQYLQGQMVTTSADGATPYGPPVAVLVKRTADQAKGQIVEDTWHGPERHSAVLTVRPGTLIFDGSDEKKTFEGTLTFETDDWLLSNLTYAITMTDQSGTLSGTGVWEGDTYRTNKVISDPTGTPRVKVSETLTIITEEAFLAAVPK